MCYVVEVKQCVVEAKQCVMLLRSSSVLCC